jgi:hypothetical protein
LNIVFGISYPKCAFSPVTEHHLSLPMRHAHIQPHLCQRYSTLPAQNAKKKKSSNLAKEHESPIKKDPQKNVLLLP